MWPTLPYYSNGGTHLPPIIGRLRGAIEFEGQSAGIFVRMPANYIKKGRVNDWLVPSWLKANIIGWCPRVLMIWGRNNLKGGLPPTIVRGRALLFYYCPPPPMI